MKYFRDTHAKKGFVLRDDYKLNDYTKLWTAETCFKHCLCFTLGGTINYGNQMICLQLLNLAPKAIKQQTSNFFTFSRLHLNDCYENYYLQMFCSAAQPEGRKAICLKLTLSYTNSP